MKVEIEKITDERIMREACEMTILGKSKMDMKKMAMCEHSPLRTQMYWIKLYGIPLFISTQLLRHHVGSQPFQLSCRDDRKGGNIHFNERIEDIIDDITEDELGDAVEKLSWLKDNADRNTKVNLGICLNAQALINMAKDRLCSDAHSKTRSIFSIIKSKIEEIEPDLAPFLVPKCIYRGGICNSLKPCGFNKSDFFRKQLEQYKLLFVR